MEICTIGFTKRTAESFFEALNHAGVRKLIDVRLHNSSQLAGFTKEADLRYFLRALLKAEYTHELLLAPTEDLLNSYRKKRISWEEYAGDFTRLLRERRIESHLDADFFSPKSALLCSEHSPERCHRRLVVEYLQGEWGNLEVTHL